jgi:acyl-CoA synthetase (AMP-forming)/AMP-acid ligase II
MTKYSTLSELLTAQPSSNIALRAPDMPPLGFAGLAELTRATGQRLNALGVGRGDRVAMVLPNGAEMASAFLAVASVATAAPLNPAYRADEFDFYLRDLRAKVLLTHPNSPPVAQAVAEKLGIAVLELAPKTSAAGAFEIMAKSAANGARPALEGLAQSTDIALILHTSGTTSRPKLVPLTQLNVCVSACNVRDTLELQPTDIGLHIMPLFHIHGLIAGLLAPLAAGSSVFCTPGFNALKFFAWLNEAKATWYTAVPTMHQAIVARAASNRAVVENNPLRFVRSSSASMPPPVIRELEQTFAAPLIEAYGMTEAAHQMASNPLHGVRIPGSVGVAAGPDVAIMNAAGDLLRAGETGEVVIRGPNVTAGYEDNPEANRAAFHAGWFRTGDQGVMDAAGYITLTGRLKEIINRGGEKISPREVDEVLMEHPAVAQVVTFALPHDKLGEEVAAAVVLRAGMTLESRELREFAAQRLADFKVPRKIVLLDEIPKGPTGKLQRIGLAQKLGLA